MQQQRQQQIIFLNGPPGSGKDTAGLFILEEYEHARVLKFAEPLKLACAALFCLSYQQVRELEAPGSTLKNTPRAITNNMSWRQALIWLSEQCIKPEFGDEFFGTRMVMRLSEPTSTTLTVITDCGFSAECIPIIRMFRAENCHIFRLHRKGCTFANDSRSYLFSRNPPPGLSIEDIHNDHARDLFKAQIIRRVDRILGRTIKREFKLV